MDLGITYGWDLCVEALKAEARTHLAELNCQPYG